MNMQAIIYNPEGKVYGVLDPMGDFVLPQDNIELLKIVNPPPNHSVLLYEKKRENAQWVGNHEFYDWQAAVDKFLGKI